MNIFQLFFKLRLMTLGRQFVAVINQQRFLRKEIRLERKTVRGLKSKWEKECISAGVANKGFRDPSVEFYRFERMIVVAEPHNDNIQSLEAKVRELDKERCQLRLSIIKLKAKLCSPKMVCSMMEKIGE